MLSMWSGDLKEEDVPVFSGDSRSTANSNLKAHVQRQTQGHHQGDCLSVLESLSEKDRAQSSRGSHRSGRKGHDTGKSTLTLGTSVMAESVDEEKEMVLKETLHTPQASYQFGSRHLKAHEQQSTEFSTSFAASFIASQITLTSQPSHAATSSSMSASSSSSSASTSYAGSTYL